MSDSYSKYIEESKEYQKLCKDLGIKPKAHDIDYDHFWELQDLPFVIYDVNEGYKVHKKAKEEYPEYFI